MSKARKIGHELSEHEIQVLVVKYLKSNNIGHFAVPNGFVTDKGPAYINYMKAEGLKNGVPDLVILYGDGNVAFLELKTNKGKLSEHQQKWHKWLNNNNYLIKTCYGYDEAIKFIDSLLTT